MSRTSIAILCLLSIATLTSCGGGGGGGAGGGAAPVAPPGNNGAPSPAASPTQSPTSAPVPKTLNVGYGEINGIDNQIVSSAPNAHANTGEGNLEPGDPGAQPQGGGQGQTVDGIPQTPKGSDNYHVHFFLGLYVNGREIAIPDGIGMMDPWGDYPSSNSCTNGAANFECFADAFYYTHTHDASGEVHIEAPSPVCGVASNLTQPCNMSIVTLGNFLDVWGISMSSNNFGAFQDTVHVYTSPLQYVGCTQNGACYTSSSTYAAYNADPRQIPLYSHVVIWVLVGSGNPTGSSLPSIQWVAGTP